MSAITFPRYKFYLVLFVLRQILVSSFAVDNFLPNQFLSFQFVEKGSTVPRLPVESGFGSFMYLDFMTRTVSVEATNLCEL